MSVEEIRDLITLQKSKESSFFWGGVVAKGGSTVTVFIVQCTFRCLYAFMRKNLCIKSDLWNELI